MTFSSFRGLWYSPTSIHLHPPKPGTHQPKVVLDLHVALCLSALTESEPHVRTGAQVSCHRHYRSGVGNLQFFNWESRITQLSTNGHPWLDSLSLSYRLHVFIARSFEVLAYGSSRLVGFCRHRSCCTLMCWYSIFKLLVQLGHIINHNTERKFCQ